MARKRGGNWIVSSRVPPLSPSPTPSPASLLSCLRFAGRKHARGLSRSVRLGEDAGTHMAGFLPVSCPLSSPPAAALGLLHMPHSHCAGTFLSLLVGYPALSTCFHSFPRNSTSPQQSGSFPAVLPSLSPLLMLCISQRIC